MNGKEDNIQQGNMKSPTQEEELVVQLNSDLMRTIQILQAYLQSFKYDNMNERIEHKRINEYLFRNMKGGSLHGKPTHTTNKSKKYFHRKWASIS